MSALESTLPPRVDHELAAIEIFDALTRAVLKTIAAIADDGLLVEPAARNAVQGMAAELLGDASSAIPNRAQALSLLFPAVRVVGDFVENLDSSAPSGDRSP